MLVFGVDIPLVEIMFVFAIIIFILLIETIIVLSLLVTQLNKAKKLSEGTEKILEVIEKLKKK